MTDGSTRHFHHLLDTFAVISYFQTRDIFQVAKWAWTYKQRLTSSQYNGHLCKFRWRATLSGLWK